MPLFRESLPGLSPEHFRLLRDMIRDFCGIQLSDDSRFLLERRLGERLVQLKLEDFGEYYRYLRYHPSGPAELERAIELVTTNETYLFRELPQLECFAQEVLPELRDSARTRRSLTIWSAGCSTGEEVYTIGILLARSGLFEGWDLRVFGNDISRRVLQVARKGVFRETSFRAMPPQYERHFIRMPEGRMVEPAIRAMCHFGHFNLLEAGRVAMVGRVDAIFCRNVLIYFGEPARRQVIQTFYERLHPGGYLMLGHSESLLHLSTAFELAHLSGDLAYRRAAVRSQAPERPFRGAR